MNKDANGAREYPTTKLVLVLANYKNAGISINLMSKAPKLIYQTKNNLMPLNDYNNPNYFIAVFSTFFFFRIDGYLIQKDGLR